MTSSIGPRRREGGIAMPIGLAFTIGTVGVAVTLWLAYVALTSESVPIVGSARGALIAMAIVGMTACAIGGIGQAPIIGWTHPITILGIGAGVLAFGIIGAGLFGWDGLVRPAAGLVPMGATIVATTERLAIGLLAGLVAIKWLAGIALTVVVMGRG